MNEEKEVVKIPMWKKICYGSAAGGGNIMSTLLATFLLSYYTDTVGIAAASIGTMFVIARLLDGITDFAMGGIVDKTNTKLGKARPWLLLSAPLMVIGVILIFSVPNGWNQAGKLIYAYITYIFLNCIVYTIFCIAHIALLARITRDFKDRNTTSTVSSIINNLVGMVVGTMIMGMVIKFGWTTTSIILGVIAGVLILITGLTIRENVGMDEGIMEKRETIPLKKQLPPVMKNKYFWITLILGALTLFANANAIGAQIFYCNVVLKQPMFMSTLMIAGMGPGLIILFVMPWFANKFSKRAFMAIGAIFMIIGFALTGMAGMNTTLLTVGTVIRSIGLGPMFAGLYAFCADSTDYGEWKTGIRSEGLMASSQSIGSKVGIGFGSACTAWVLAIANYNPAQAPTDTVIKAIRFDYGWLGVIVSVILLIGIMMMDVEKYLPEIRKTIGEKKPPMM